MTKSQWEDFEKKYLKENLKNKYKTENYGKIIMYPGKCGWYGTVIEKGKKYYKGYFSWDDFQSAQKDADNAKKERNIDIIEVLCNQ